MRAIAFLLFLPFTAFGAAGLPDEPFISATGEASISVKPDGVRIMINATGRGTSATEAFQQSVARAQGLLAAAESVGIKADQIEAADISVRDESRYRNDDQEKPYVADRAITIEVRDLERVSPLLDALIRADVSQIGHIERFVDNEEEVAARVEELAFTNAKSKAERYAAMDGRSLGELWWVGDEVGLMRFDSPAHFASMAPQDALPYFSTGEIEFAKEVEVVYLLD